MVSDFRDSLAGSPWIASSQRTQSFRLLHGRARHEASSRKALASVWVGPWGQHWRYNTSPFHFFDSTADRYVQLSTHPLFFSSPTTDGVTEEEDGLSSKASADLSHLGTIIVKAHRAKAWSTLPYIDKLRTSPSELPAVSEKSKKAASHCIRLELPSVRIRAVQHLLIFHQPRCAADAEISPSCPRCRTPRQIPCCHFHIPIRIQRRVIIRTYLRTSL